MVESEGLIDYACESGTPAQKAVTQPLIEDYRRYLNWEKRHARLMQVVADSRTTQQQVHRLRQIIIEMLHNGALFKYLRDYGIRGRDRELLVASFYPTRDFNDAVVGVRREVCGSDLQIAIRRPPAPHASRLTHRKNHGREAAPTP